VLGVLTTAVLFTVDRHHPLGGTRGNPPSTPYLPSTCYYRKKMKLKIIT
jgi:hypothetical protein